MSPDELLKLWDLGVAEIPKRKVQRLVLDVSPPHVTRPGELAFGRARCDVPFRASRILVNIHGHGRTIELFDKAHGGTRSRKKGRRRSHLFFALLLRNPRPSITLDDIRIGTASQMFGSVPAEMFARYSGHDVDVHLDVAKPEMDITVTFTNRDYQLIHVRCTVVGTTL